MGRIGRLLVASLLVVSLGLPAQPVAASDQSYLLEAVAAAQIEPASKLESSSTVVADTVDPFEVVAPGQPSESEPGPTYLHTSSLTEASEVAGLAVDSIDPSDNQDLLPPSDDDQEPSPVNNHAQVVISKFQIGPANNEFVELFNFGDVAVDLTGWRLEYLKADHTGDVEPTRTLARLNLTLEPQSFYIVKHKAYDLLGSDADFSSNPTSGALALNGSIRLVMPDDQVADLVGWGRANQSEGTPTASDQLAAWQRCGNDEFPVIDTDDNSVDFRMYDSLLLRTIVACQPPEPQVPVNNCEGLVISEIGANLSRQFIEILNHSNQDVDVSGCQLQTNRSQDKYVLDGEIEAGEYRVVMVDDTSLTLTKTTTGAVYLLSSDGLVEVDSREYSGLAAETSWARFGDDDWRQTYSLTPGEANQYQPDEPCPSGQYRHPETNRCRQEVASQSVLKPCAPDQYRHPETNRCRKLESTSSSLKPCAANQYRHPETNRCRALTTAASSLKPCAPDQYRNPATNRCRKLDGAQSLTDCGPGRERNPETNRCRTIKSDTIPAAGFAAVPVADSPQAVVSWGLLAGVSALVAAYASWEWRREISGFVRRVGQALARQGK